MLVSANHRAPWWRLPVPSDCTDHASDQISELELRTHRPQPWFDTYLEVIYVNLWKATALTRSRPRCQFG